MTYFFDSALAFVESRLKNVIFTFQFPLPAFENEKPFFNFDFYISVLRERIRKKRIAKEQLEIEREQLQYTQGDKHQ